MSAASAFHHDYGFSSHRASNYSSWLFAGDYAEHWSAKVRPSSMFLNHGGRSVLPNAVSVRSVPQAAQRLLPFRGDDRYYTRTVRHVASACGDGKLSEQPRNLSSTIP